MSAIELKQNAICSMLPETALRRIERAFVVVTAVPGDVLVHAGEPADNVWFPLDLVVSLDQVLDDAAEALVAPAVALIGNEGAVGLEPILGGGTAVNQATVRIGGRVLRLEASLLRDEFVRAGVLHRLLLRHADPLVCQICAVAACERVHSVRQRLIRWLLSFDDRIALHNAELTQETLSQLMGVRRVSVSAAASEMQADGLIAYQRGNFTILDREALTLRSCQCYREISARYREYLQPD